MSARKRPSEDEAAATPAKRRNRSHGGATFTFDAAGAVAAMEGDEEAREALEKHLAVPLGVESLGSAEGRAAVRDLTIRRATLVNQRFVVSMTLYGEVKARSGLAGLRTTPALRQSAAGAWRAAVALADAKARQTADQKAAKARKQAARTGVMGSLAKKFGAKKKPLFPADWKVEDDAASPLTFVPTGMRLAGADEAYAYMYGGGIDSNRVLAGLVPPGTPPFAEGVMSTMDEHAKALLSSRVRQLKAEHGVADDEAPAPAEARDDTVDGDVHVVGNIWDCGASVDASGKFFMSDRTNADCPDSHCIEFLALFIALDGKPTQQERERGMAALAAAVGDGEALTRAWYVVLDRDALFERERRTLQYAHDLGEAEDGGETPKHLAATAADAVYWDRSGCVRTRQTDELAETWHDVVPAFLQFGKVLQEVVKAQDVRSVAEPMRVGDDFAEDSEEETDRDEEYDEEVDDEDEDGDGHGPGPGHAQPAAHAPAPAPVPGAEAEGGSEAGSAAPPLSSDDDSEGSGDEESGDSEAGSGSESESESESAGAGAGDGSTRDSAIHID